MTEDCIEKITAMANVMIVQNMKQLTTSVSIMRLETKSRIGTWMDRADEMVQVSMRRYCLHYMNVIYVICEYSLQNLFCLGLM